MGRLGPGREHALPRGRRRRGGGWLGHPGPPSTPPHPPPPRAPAASRLPPAGAAPPLSPRSLPSAWRVPARRGRVIQRQERAFGGEGKKKPRQKNDDNNKTGFFPPPPLPPFCWRIGSAMNSCLVLFGSANPFITCNCLDCMQMDSMLWEACDLAPGHYSW